MFPVTSPLTFQTIEESPEKGPKHQPEGTGDTAICAVVQCAFGPACLLKEEDKKDKTNLFYVLAVELLSEEGK